MSNHDRHGQHIYGSVHKAQRKRWARVVAAGGVWCWRCGKPIPPGGLGTWGTSMMRAAGRVFRSATRSTGPATAPP